MQDVHGLQASIFGLAQKVMLSLPPATLRGKRRGRCVSYRGSACCSKAMKDYHRSQGDCAGLLDSRT